jgi:hypothetical protein
MVRIKKVLALCMMIVVVSASTGFSQDAVSDRIRILDLMRNQWDSVVANRPLETGRTDLSAAGLRQSIQYEFAALQRSDINAKLERHVRKYLGHATFAVRISDRGEGSESRARPDYGRPKVDYIEWIIGLPGDMISFIYEDLKHAGRIRVKTLHVAPSFLDSLSSLQRNYYLFTDDPPWVSTVSLWTPQAANIFYVYGLQPLILRDKEGHFVYPAPTGLRSLARITGIPFGYK